MSLKTAVHALERSLAPTVLLRHMSAARTGAAGVPRGHRNEMATLPLQLVVQLPEKLAPTLIEDRLVESRLGPDACARLLLRAARRCRHMDHLQILDAHERVVFADRGRELVEVVMTGAGDATVQSLNATPGLVPVLAEPDFPTQCLLRFPQRNLVSAKTVQRCMERAVGEGGEPHDPHVDAHVRAFREGKLDVAFGLNGYVPLVARATDRDVPDRSQHLSTVAIRQPAELGQEDAPIGLVQPDLLRCRITERVPSSTSLAAWKRCAPGEEIVVGAAQVLELLLQGLCRRIRQPPGVRRMTPGRQHAAKGRIAEVFLALCMTFLLQRQGTVVDKPAVPGEATQHAQLRAVGSQFVLVGQAELHG